MHNTGKFMSQSTANYYCSSVLLILETHCGWLVKKLLGGAIYI